MQEQKLIILSILKNFLGEPKSVGNSENKTQWEFNCPSHKCRNDYDKFNLAFNSDLNVFKCWKCKESGIVHKLVRNYGTKEDYKKLELILPTYINNHINVFRKQEFDYNTIICPLPEGFTPIVTESKTAMHKLALNYVLNDRKLSWQQLIDYNIGYTEIGAYRNRVIIPSYNKNNNINYFEARTFLKNSKLSYYKPDKKVFGNKNVPEKYDIIFNEKNINWNLPVYLVEGVFDMFRIPNSIPMLGKTPSWLLISLLIKHQCKVVICLDEDAIDDSFEIYDMLMSLGLDVYFVDLKGIGDISYHYEKNGQNAIVELLKTKKKINFFYKFSKILN